MTKKRTSYLILISLVIIEISMSFPAYGVDYDKEISASEVDGHMWMEMTPTERKAFTLGLLHVYAITGDGPAKMSMVPRVINLITSNYEESGNLDKNVTENIASFGDAKNTYEGPVGEEKNVIVVEYSGSGMKTTRPFTVNSSWEIQWEAHGMIFQVYLYSEDGQLVDVLANQQGEGKGSSYSPKTGSYYLEVNAMGNWEVKIVKVDN